MSERLKTQRMALLVLGAMLPAVGHTEVNERMKLPLWEFGAGIAGLNLPYYRGSDEKVSYLVPYPYLIYRGARLKVDEVEGARSRVFQSERIKLDISLAGGVPVPRDDAEVRAGMPGLDPTAELGPSLSVRLWNDGDMQRNLWLRLPLRTVFSVGRSGVEYQGLALAPFVEWTTSSGAYNNLRRTSISIGPLFADKNYHAYFYEVSAADSTTQRPKYNASGGYSGSRITLKAQKRFDDLRTEIFVRYDSLNGAVFVDSPLVRNKEYLIVGFAMSWVFAKSSRRVEAGQGQE